MQTILEQSTNNGSLNLHIEQVHVSPHTDDPQTNTHQQHAPIDEFLKSISTTPPRPVLAERPRQVEATQNTTPLSKRQSTRLAQKAAANSGKGPIEVAHDLLVKKLGSLAGPESSVTNESPLPDGCNLYVQHFARPLDKTAMGAIQDLIEQGGVIELKDALDSEPAAPGMEA